LLLTSKDDGTFNSILATFAIRKLFPGVDVTVVSTPKGFIAKGNVNEPQVAEKIREILVKLSHEGEKDFVDLMKVDPQQVLICVRVLEVSKEVTCKLGINWKALYENSGYSVALGAVFPRPLPTDPNYFIRADNVVAGNFTLDAIIDMLQQDNMGRVLAEPNLTTVSGRPATFFSGGEFPILIPQGGTLAGTVTVEYKKFGVILAFTPIVDLSGLITLHIVPEVSTIDEKNSVVIEGFKIPALVARRVDTTVKLWPGQSYAIAGLMQYDKLARYSSLYGLHRLPIIGPLFRSKEFIQQRTELMFVITPYLIYSDDPEHYLDCRENCKEEATFCETPYCHY
jgi:pilus assembly protein CpaC